MYFDDTKLHVGLYFELSAEISPFSLGWLLSQKQEKKTQLNHCPFCSGCSMVLCVRDYWVQGYFRENLGPGLPVSSLASATAAHQTLRVHTSAPPPASVSIERDPLHPISQWKAYGVKQTVMYSTVSELISPQRSPLYKQSQAELATGVPHSLSQPCNLSCGSGPEAWSPLIPTVLLARA